MLQAVEHACRAIFLGRSSAKLESSQLCASTSHVIVDLDGALGLPSSFLDEAFGPFAGEVEAGKLEIHLTDNAVAKTILLDCLAKHAA